MIVAHIQRPDVGAGSSIRLRPETPEELELLKLVSPAAVKAEGRKLILTADPEATVFRNINWTYVPRSGALLQRRSKFNLPHFNARHVKVTLEGDSLVIDPFAEGTKPAVHQIIKAHEALQRKLARANTDTPPDDLPPTPASMQPAIEAPVPDHQPFVPVAPSGMSATYREALTGALRSLNELVAANPTVTIHIENNQVFAAESLTIRQRIA
jgi:virulence-associated protein VagC